MVPSNSADVLNSLSLYFHQPVHTGLNLKFLFVIVFLQAVFYIFFRV